jgi:23S rRNA (uracil1939-C5)-methyltransferase
MARRTSGLRFQPASGTPADNPPVGKKQLLDIERLAHDGRGIAHCDGRTWFVSGALPQERVEARVLAARSKLVEARVERVLQAAGLRRQPACTVAGRCGGCSLQHLPHAEQVALKQRNLAEQLQRIAGIQPDEWAAPLSGPEYGYRRRTRIAVRWDAKRKQLDVGFRAAASQEIIAVQECPVLVEPLQQILRDLPAALQGLARPERIGHVELFSGTCNVLLLRHTAAMAEADVEALRAFCSVRQVQLWWQGEGEPQADQANQANLAPGYALPDFGLELQWQPGDFVQVNAAINQQMISQALDWLAPQPDERVLDLFCGLGNFALPLAQRSREVLAVEAVPAMLERARANAQNHGLHNLHFVQADLGQPLPPGPRFAGFAAALLDPPRDGALALVQQMGELSLQRLVYVSCNPATLARDAAELVRQGYRLSRAGILDMFPQTAHVEAMALFERNQQQ